MPGEGQDGTRGLHGDQVCVSAVVVCKGCDTMGCVTEYFSFSVIEPSLNLILCCMLCAGIV